MKLLFSIAPKDGKGGEVTGVLVGRWPREHQTLTSASGVLSAEARAGERASDVVVLKRQTPSVSVCCEWRQQLRKPRQRQMCSASGDPSSDASGEKSAQLGAY
jgi:hypothetical protein